MGAEPNLGEDVASDETSGEFRRPDFIQEEGLNVPSAVLDDADFLSLHMQMDGLQPRDEFKFDKPIVLSDDIAVQAQAVPRRIRPGGSFTMHLQPHQKVIFEEEIRDTTGRIYMSRFRIDGIPYTFHAAKSTLLLGNVINANVTKETRQIGPKPDDIERFNTAIELVMKGVS